MRRAFVSILCGFLAAIPLSDATAQQAERRIELTQDSDYFGFDLRSERDVSLEECQRICLDDDGCRAFTYNTQAQWCFLKSDFGELSPFAGAVAGRVVEAAPEPDIGPAPRLGFVPPDTAAGAAQARREAVALAREESLTGVELALQAASKELATGDSEDAERMAKAAAGADAENIDNWLTVTRFALDRGGDDWRMRRLAISGAFNAYQLSRTTSKRAESLGLLARAFEKQAIYRPALQGYKASLELADSPALAAAYASLRSREGFRVTGNSVDADTANPRICVQFSEELLQTGVDYTEFVTVDGQSGGEIEVQTQQICAAGLEHGKTYRMALRAGLPSTVDEVLETPVVINAYIRDRAPAVRFSGENFVLPRFARQGIPIYGINADGADLELYRIGDRAVASLISGSRFLGQLAGYGLEELRDDLGQSVWEGSIELARERNREIATSFPVDEVLKAREPGIYVLTAKVAGSQSDYWEQQATQWFLVSDIGLTTYAGSDGLTVFARSLNSGEAIEGVELTLIARNNEILGTATSDSAGKARLEPGLVRGTGGLSPVALTARRPTAEGAPAGDFVFLDMTRAGFDLSDRGVTGREAPGPIDVMAWTERGIYRPGETVHAMSLARDDAGNALANLPLTITFRRPDGVVAQRVASSDPATGGHYVPFAVPDNAMRGVWTMEVATDPDKAALAQHLFLVEDFRPDRIEFSLESTQKAISPDMPATIEVDGRFLYGAPANDLALEGEARISPTRSLAAFPGYVFGLEDEGDDGATLLPLGGLPRTDAQGHAQFDLELGSLPETTRPLGADVTVRMREDGGRAVEESLHLPVQTDRLRIGIRPLFEDEAPENSTASFQVIAARDDGTRAALADLDWALYRIERNYQWYRDSYSWRYEPVEISRQIADGRVTIGPDQPARISADVEWGRYRLDIESAEPDGPASSLIFDAGYYASGNPAETPDALEIALDKEIYAPGETARLQVSSRFAGHLLVAIGGDRLMESFEQKIDAGDGSVTFPVRGEWGAGAYVTATLFQPGEAAESRTPMRAVGTTWLKVDPKAHRLDIAMDVAEQMRPDAPLVVPISVTGLPAGETAHVTLAAVDVGILNLTDYEAPDPVDWYFGQRRLGLEIRDIYGRLIDGSIGAAGRVRSGGDGPALSAQGSPPTEKLLALFSGIVALDENGRSEIVMEVPPFNGTARLMAVAWSDSAVGGASRDVVIRDPVVMTASLPKVMAPGDEAQTVLEIANTDGPAGDYEIVITADENVVVGDMPGRLTLAAGERRNVVLPVRAARSGVAEIRIEARHDGQPLATRTQLVNVRPATLPVTVERSVELAANGGSITVDGEILAQSLVENATVSINVARHTGFNVSSLIMKLNRYPYGCAEQTTSKALPLLYLSEFALPDGMIGTTEIRERVQNAIERVLGFQGSSGAFGLWGPGDGEFWLDAYVTDFLTRAIEKSYTVSETAMRLALDNLQNKLGYQDDLSEDGDAVAYALYVLARNRRASAGDLRYYADTRLEEFVSPLARAQLAAALSLYNEAERANRVFSSALALAVRTESLRDDRNDFGTHLRDGAAMVTLASEARPAATSLDEMIDFVADRVAESRYTSTQENAWMLLAARATQSANESLMLTVDGVSHQGRLALSMDGESILARPVEVANAGPEKVDAVVTAIASPRDPLPAGGLGFEIERRYFTLDGEPAQMVEVAQNQRFVVVLTVTEEEARNSRVLVTDLLPGGLEIDNPRLVDSAALDKFDWLGEVEVAHSEFRDDRFVAAFDRTPGSSRSFSLAYVVRAVTPGRYVHPAASVEDMYRPENAARTATGFLAVTPAQ